MNLSIQARRAALLLAGAVAALASGCAIHVTHTEGGNSGKLSLNAAGTASFQCVASPSGECHYALYTSRCSTAEGEAGQPATTCTHQVIRQFTVATGQTQEVRDLPQGFKQCMKTGSKPKVPDCGA